MIILQEPSLKERLATKGLATPPGGTASSPDDACAITHRIGYPAIVKALAPVGDRGGKGFVAIVHSDSDVRLEASRLLGTDAEGHRITQLRVESLLPEGSDYYLGVTFDFVQGEPVLLWGPGGSGVERWLIPNRQTFELVEGPEYSPLPVELRPAAVALFDVFVETGARLVELNPIRVIGGRPVVLDAKAVLDPVNPPPEDATAVGRLSSEATARLDKQLSELGTTAKVHYEEFSGDVGLVMWGGGSTMIALDALQRWGLEPANYSDMAAGTFQTQVIGLLARAVLEHPLRGAMVGSTVSSALSAIQVGRALDEAIAERSAVNHGDIPIAIRLAGQDEDEAKVLLERRSHVRHFGRDECLEDAVAWLAAELGAT